MQRSIAVAGSLERGPSLTVRQLDLRALWVLEIEQRLGEGDGLDCILKAVLNRVSDRWRLVFERPLGEGEADLFLRLAPV